MRRLPVSTLALTVAIAGPLVSRIAYSEEASVQATSVAKTQSSRMVVGEVLTVDGDRSKIVIKHQELEELGMPAMTMIFSVPDKSLLKGVIAGGKIKFAAQVAPNGLSVIKLESENN